MDEYLSGTKLYGDDFTLDQIQKWYEEESDGFANLGFKDESTDYGYHTMNKVHGFNKLKNKYFESVLGFGSAFGYEFEPIINRIKRLTIIEPSVKRSDRIGNLIPIYVMPEIDGRLTFISNFFDLITCFGVLHHISNVSFVLKELIRVLEPNGYLLLREPINSMEDWRFPRKGLSKNERGIPVSFFENVFNNEPIEIVSRVYCFTAPSVFEKLGSRLFKRTVYLPKYKSFIFFDKLISFSLKGNVHYHAEKMIHKIAPSSVFYVIKKL